MNPKTGLIETEVEIPEKGIARRIINKILWGNAEGTFTPSFKTGVFQNQAEEDLEIEAVKEAEDKEKSL